MASTLPYRMCAPSLTASPSRNPSKPAGLPLRLPGNEPRNTEYIRISLGTRSRKFFHLLNESSRHHETTGLRPTMGTVLELGHLPLAVNGFVGDAWQQSLERWSQTSDHRVLCGSRFQGDEYRVEAKAGRGSDSQLANLRWNIGEAGVQHFDAATPSTGIPGTEFGVPEVGRIGLDAEQWIVGFLSTIAGIVTDGGIFLIAEYRHHRAVQIEDQSGALSGQVDERLQQSVVDAVRLLPEGVRCV